MSFKGISRFFNYRQYFLPSKTHFKLINSYVMENSMNSKNFFYNLQSLFLIQIKHKHKNVKNFDEDDDYVEIEFDESELTKASKILNVTVSTMRVDLILKTGLGISRNKTEVAFYESKIRKNGKKVLKKSENVSVGDELDLILDQAKNNHNLYTVSRLKIIAAKLDGDHYKVKIVRDKNLLVEKEDSFS